MVDHRIHSSAQVLRCSAISDSAKANSSTKSRSLDTSRLLAATPSKPSRRATSSRSIGRLVPASAAAPRLEHVRAAAAIGQPAAIALELLAVGQPVVGGQHRLGPLQVRVAGQDAARVLVAAADEGPLQVDQPASIWSIASRTQSRRSVETWSLRLRAVCSLRPTSPSRSIRARSMCMWMSSSSMRNAKRALLNLLADFGQALAQSAGIRRR